MTVADKVAGLFGMGPSFVFENKTSAAVTLIVADDPTRLQLVKKEVVRGGKAGVEAGVAGAGAAVEVNAKTRYVYEVKGNGDNVQAFRINPGQSSTLMTKVRNFM